jgi:hypothetical protein
MGHPESENPVQVQRTFLLSTLIELSHYRVKNHIAAVHEQILRDKKKSPRKRHFNQTPMVSVQCIRTSSNKLSFSISEVESITVSCTTVIESIKKSILQNSHFVAREKKHLNVELFKVVTAKMGERFFNACGLQDFQYYKLLGTDISINHVVWYQYLEKCQRSFQPANTCYKIYNAIMSDQVVMNKENPTTIKHPFAVLLGIQYAYLREKLRAHAAYEIDQRSTHALYCRDLITKLSLNHRVAAAPPYIAEMFVPPRTTRPKRVQFSSEPRALTK